MLKFFSLSLFALFLGAQGLMAKDLVIHANGSASWMGKTYRCAVGENGLVDGNNRLDGSKTTPRGTYKITRILYRPDRLSKPDVKLPLAPITPETLTCSQEGHPLFNTIIEGPSTLKATKLHHEVNWFDVVAVIDYNTPGGHWGDGKVQKPNPKLGYGILLHVEKGNFIPSRGCVGFNRDDLLHILHDFGPEDRVVIGG